MSSSNHEGGDNEEENMGEEEEEEESQEAKKKTGEEESLKEAASITATPKVLPHNQVKINTTILAPSEIRKGLAESITEKNANIFKYTVEHVPRKRNVVQPREKKETEVEENAPEENTKENENEEGDEGEVQENLSEEEEATREPTPEPYNPYVDFQLSDHDLPLVARLLRNVEPNFLWTWTRDSISFKHLSREQVVNRFPNTPFTTKVRK